MRDDVKHPEIPLTAVASKAVSHIGYDADSQTLAVRFSKGTTYHYANVPASLHHELAQAKSIGKELYRLRPFKFRLIECEKEKADEHSAVGTD